MRNLAKGEKVLAALAKAGADISNIELIKANLSDPSGWDAAVEGCQFIQHIASPFPVEPPSNREALVEDAREGALRLIKLGLSAGVKRIVMTSSSLAMTGKNHKSKLVKFNENDWSDPDWKPMTAYPISKTRAEKSAWDYVREQEQSEQLCVINPGLVLGPDLFNNSGASMHLIAAMMGGEFSLVPKAAYPIIDVRDVASIHCAAMIAKEAAGRRLIAATNTLSFGEIATILRQAYPKSKLPRGEMPNIATRFIALFDDRVRNILPDLGKRFVADNNYVTTITQVMPRPAKEAVLAAAESLLANKRVVLA